MTHNSNVFNEPCGMSNRCSSGAFPEFSQTFKQFVTSSKRIANLLLTSKPNLAHDPSREAQAESSQGLRALTMVDPPLHTLSFSGHYASVRQTNQVTVSIT